MDKGKSSAKTWGWLPAHMPGVSKLLADKRQEHGKEHVALCWQRGVIEQKPGWFFAREGPLAVGVMWDEMADVAGWQVTPDQALVILATPDKGAAHGAH